MFMIDITVIICCFILKSFKHVSASNTKNGFILKRTCFKMKLFFLDHHFYMAIREVLKKSLFPRNMKKSYSSKIVVGDDLDPVVSKCF